MSTTQTSLPSDNDTKRITAQLNTGASTSDMGREAYRLCRINALLRCDVAKLRAELRASKQKQAVMEDALAEMRAELPPTRDLLDRVWRFMPERKLSGDVKMKYGALRGGDPFERQPGFRQPRSKGRQRLRSSKGEGRGEKRMEATGEGNTGFLLHTHEGEAYDMEDSESVDGEEDNDGDEVDEHSNTGNINITSSTDIQPSKAAVSTDVVTARKRKAVEQDGIVAKRIKSSNNFIIAGGMIARSIAGLKRKRAIETVNTALKKQGVAKAEGNAAAGDDV